MTGKFDRLQLITTFLAVADQRSLSAAARQLGTSQPTVSRRFRQLETALGVRLALRSTHRFELTTEGEALHRRAGAWADEWSEWEDALKGTSDLPKGKLVLIGPHGYGHAFLMDAVQRFRRAHPQVEVELRLTDRQVDLLSQGADCWIRVGGASDQSLHVRPIGRMHRILVASRAFMQTHRIQRPEDLSKVPFVGLIPHVMKSVLLQAVTGHHQQRVPIRTEVATDGLLASYRAMREGLGVAASARWLCQSDLDRGEIVHVLREWQLEPIQIEAASVAGRFRPARINAFVDILRERMRELEGFEPT